MSGLKSEALFSYEHAFTRNIGWVTECEQARNRTDPVSALEVCRSLRALPHNQQQLELLDELISQIEPQPVLPDTNMPDPSELRSSCLAGDTMTHDAAVEVCVRALLVNQGDADIQRVLVSYRASNAPLDLVEGEYGAVSALGHDPGL